MSLRNRKVPLSDKPQYREFSDSEVQSGACPEVRYKAGYGSYDRSLTDALALQFKIIEIFEKYDVRCANFVLLQVR